MRVYLLDRLGGIRVVEQLRGLDAFKLTSERENTSDGRLLNFCSGVRTNANYRAVELDRRRCRVL